jgi:hypothetical protein
LAVLLTVSLFLLGFALSTVGNAAHAPGSLWFSAGAGLLLSSAVLLIASVRARWLDEAARVRQYQRLLTEFGVARLETLPATSQVSFLRAVARRLPPRLDPLDELRKLREQALRANHPLLAADIGAAWQRSAEYATAIHALAALRGEFPDPVTLQRLAAQAPSYAAVLDHALLLLVSSLLTPLDSFRRRVRRGRWVNFLNLPLGAEGARNFAHVRAEHRLRRIEDLMKAHEMGGHGV